MSCHARAGSTGFNHHRTTYTAASQPASSLFSRTSAHSSRAPRGCRRATPTHYLLPRRTASITLLPRPWPRLLLSLLLVLWHWSSPAAAPPIVSHIRNRRRESEALGGKGGGRSRSSRTTTTLSIQSNLVQHASRFFFSTQTLPPHLLLFHPSFPPAHPTSQPLPRTLSPSTSRTTSPVERSHDDCWIRWVWGTVTVYLFNRR
jgi:hypothetical protein